MFNIEGWNWAHYILISFWFLRLAFHGANHGKPMELKWNWFGQVTNIGITFVLLYFGGFFRGF